MIRVTLVKLVMMPSHVLINIWVSFTNTPHEFRVWISSIIRKNIALSSSSLRAASVLLLSFGCRIFPVDYLLACCVRVYTFLFPPLVF